MKDFLIKLVSDERGNISSARFLNIVVGLCGCLFCWKLVLMGGFSEGYFGLLLAYGGGNYGWGKLMETRREASTTSAARGGAHSTEGGAGRGGRTGAAGAVPHNAEPGGAEETPEETAVRRRLSAGED